VRRKFVEVIEEQGYDFAAYTMGFSFDVTKPFEYAQFLKNLPLHSKMKNRCEKNAGRGGGHDKFLRMITANLIINAPRNYWQQEATYTVGSPPRNSQSTMHKLKDVEKFDCTHFLSPNEATPRPIQWAFKGLLAIANFVQWYDRKYAVNGKRYMSAFLAESFLQARGVTYNYATIDNILKQRHNHSLWMFDCYVWREICLQIYEQLEHPELLSVEKVDGRLRLKDKFNKNFNNTTIGEN